MAPWALRPPLPWGSTITLEADVEGFLGDATARVPPLISTGRRPGGKGNLVLIVVEEPFGPQQASR